MYNHRQAMHWSVGGPLLPHLAIIECRLLTHPDQFAYVAL
jgi:hypothetical protein